MAVNLTPQYHEAEQEYKRAQTAEERLECLRKMYQLVPKHKASEKLQAELKTKMSDLKDEVEKEKKSGKKAGVSYKVPKQGAGQYVILGGPNVGKSKLLTQVTKAKAEVAAFPFTTREPIVGMMEFEDIRMQLIDLPPVTGDFLEGFITSMTRSADAALLMVDLADDDGPFAAQAVIDQLANHKTIVTGQPVEGEVEPGIQFVKTLLLGNKVDDPGAMGRWEFVVEQFGDRFPTLLISAETGQGLQELKAEMYRILNVIRIYTKQPGKPPDMTSPFTVPIGSTVVELAGCVHRDFTDKLKSARVWGTEVFDGQTVKRDYVLKDRDVVELHV